MFPVLFIVFPVLLESEAAELDNKIVEIEIQSNQYPIGLIDNFNQTSTKLSFVNTTFDGSLSIPSTDLDRVRNMELDAILRLNYTGNVWMYSIIHLSTSESSNEAKSRIIASLVNFENNITETRISEGGLDVN